MVLVTFEPAENRKMHKKSKSKGSKCIEMAVYGPYKFLQIDFTENLSDRKVIKFPHCGAFTNFIT